MWSRREQEEAETHICLSSGLMLFRLVSHWKLCWSLNISKPPTSKIHVTCRGAGTLHHGISHKCGPGFRDSEENLWELEDLQAQLLPSTKNANQKVCNKTGELQQHQPYIPLLASLCPPISLVGNTDPEPVKERNLGNLSSNLAKLIQC